MPFVFVEFLVMSKQLIVGLSKLEADLQQTNFLDGLIDIFID